MFELWSDILGGGKLRKEQLGQFFTPSTIVQQMIGLIQNKGRILEPSCGDGAFYNQIADCIGIEIDANVAPVNALVMDFFDYNESVDTIIGNPPYVRYQDILSSTKSKLPNVLDNRSNLYLFFMWHSLDILADNGELIFIVPRDFIKLTSAAKLNERLYQEGGFTYWQEFGDQRIFANASPNVAIFRWVKGQPHTIPISYTNGCLTFNSISTLTTIADFFDVKVGGASGLNGVFYESTGNIDLVISTTKRTGQTIKAHYVEQPNAYLQQHKAELMARRIKTFTENNWWEWGRKINHIDGDKIYVNMKTRDPKPFFTNPSGWYDGSVLGLIPKFKWYASIDEVVEHLNQWDWEQEGLLVGGRYIFGQRSLSNAHYNTTPN